VRTRGGSISTWTTRRALAITVTDVVVENVAPIITSAATASFAENATGTAYQIIASDADASHMQHGVLVARFDPLIRVPDGRPPNSACIVNFGLVVKD